jgi:4-aminobutyrate aminotransferase/(S)-3-amino-2-methylpropionate transaminase
VNRIGPCIRVPPPGPRSRELAARLAAVECPAFDARREAREAASGAEQAPIVYARGDGDLVEDADGNVYVDLTAGFGACILGHAPAAVTSPVKAALDRLPLALGDVYGSDVKVEAAEAIAALFHEPGARVLFGTSGADAVTAALKTAALATGRAGVLAFEGAYHGLSHGPLALCGLAPSFREPFAAQLGAHVRFAPYPASEGELDACMMQIRGELATRRFGAVVVEPLLGRGGCVAPPAAFLPALRAACDETSTLLVADEIWTGMGRAGALVASAGARPDVVCLGKGLGAGYPVSACVGRAGVMAAWGAHGGSAIHTGTHFGAPPSCAAALATLAEVRRLDLPARSAELGARFTASLATALGDRAHVRGRGLMIGVALADAARALAAARALLARGYIVLTGGARGDTLTLTPALTVDEGALEGFVTALDAVLGDGSGIPRDRIS